MTFTVFLAVIAAAAMHAGWNAMLKLRLDPFLGLALLSGTAGLVALPLVTIFGWPRAEAWPWLGLSFVLHMAYYGALAEAYRRADMSQIYPIARGGAPLLTAAVAAGVLGEPVGLVASVGIGTLGAGVILMSLRGRRAGAAFDTVAIGLALLTACIISGYTLVDGLGARAAGDPHAFSAALFVINGIPLPLLVLWRRGMAGVMPALRLALPGFAGGAMSLGSYWIAIWAMTIAPIALVAALRETSVLFAALIAVIVLKEPLAPARIAAGLLILAGLALIRLQ